MPGTLSQADLIADLKSSLQDAAKIFNAADDADFIRHLTTAAADLSKHKPRKLLATLTLTADQALYDSPDAIIQPSLVLWGDAQRKNSKPWESYFPKTPPTITLLETDTTKKIHLNPAPTAAEIGTLGATFAYTYSASHVIDAAATNTTIAAADRDLLLLRAQAEAMRELAMRNLQKPITMVAGGGQASKNGTPAGLYAALLAEFGRRVKL